MNFEKHIPKQEGEKAFKWLTNINIEDQEQQKRFYEAMSKEVRFSEAKTNSGENIPDIVALEVRDKVFGTIKPEIKTLLDTLKKIDPNSEIGIEPFEDGEAVYYRGTILGFLLVALSKEGGDLRSFDPDREGFEALETTVITDRRETAENYAKEHSVDKPIIKHDIRGISGQLNIDPTVIRKDYSTLLTPVVLNFKKVPATENPKFMHEYQTDYPLNLYTDLTDASKQKLADVTGLSLDQMKAILEKNKK